MLRSLCWGNGRARKDLNCSKKIYISEKTLDICGKKEINKHFRYHINYRAIFKNNYSTTTLFSPNYTIQKLRPYCSILFEKNKIKRQMLRQDITHGGVNMVDIETYCINLFALACSLSPTDFLFFWTTTFPA